MTDRTYAALYEMGQAYDAVPWHQYWLTDNTHEDFMSRSKRAIWAHWFDGLRGDALVEAFMMEADNIIQEIMDELSDETLKKFLNESELIPHRFLMLQSIDGDPLFGLPVLDPAVVKRLNDIVKDGFVVINKAGSAVNVLMEEYYPKPHHFHPFPHGGWHERLYIHTWNDEDRAKVRLLFS